MMSLTQQAFSARWVRFGKKLCDTKFFPVTPDLPFATPRKRGPSLCSHFALDYCGPRFRGDEAENVDTHPLSSCLAPAAFTCSHFQTARSLRQPRIVTDRSSQTEIVPCCFAGRGGSPVLPLFFRPPIEGDGAPTRRSARIAPGDVRQRPDHDARLCCAQRCTRAYRRANAASSACASSTLGPARIMRPDRLPSVACGIGLRQRRPAGAAPVPRLARRLMKAPLEARNGIHVYR